MAEFSIMCFAWNASGLRLCETMSRSAADAARKGIRGFLKPACVTPDFFESIRGIINAKQPRVVVMSTEDEDSSDTYFHSDLLPKGMKEINYTLLKRDKFGGIGEAASQVPQLRVASGKPSGSALRMSIYAHNDIFPTLKIEEAILAKFFKDNAMLEFSCAQGNRVSGAIASYISHPSYGKFLFLNTQFVAGIDALRAGVDLDYDTYREATTAANKLCMINMLNKFVDAVPKAAQPDHVFIMGDLNYDIVMPGKTSRELLQLVSSDISAAAMRRLQQYDELKVALAQKPLIGFKEGVGNEGPLFVPTWKLARGRSDKCVPGDNTSKIEAACFADPRSGGGAGWHDRILYKESMTSTYIAHCLEYSRLDIQNMHESSHAGVYAVFEMRSFS